MISVQNRLPLLSGNKWPLFWLGALLLAGCGPKLNPVNTPVKKADTVATATKITQVKPVAEPAYRPVIALILPFNLDRINLSPAAGKEGIAKADLAGDYYEGFRLALDSLTASGYNFKLQVFDSKDENAQAYNLALNTRVRTANIIVGPVYPEGLRSFSSASGALRKLTISPLSPASPADYKNPYLVTLMPPLQYHSRKAAAYVVDNLKAQKVFILKSGYTEDNKYTVPFARAIDSLGKKKVKVVTVTVVRGNLKALVPQLSNKEENVFVVPSTNQQFLQVTLHSLDTLNKHFPVTLIGHPSWEKVKFLNSGLLQRLHTVITSTDRVNYHHADVINFIKAYRKKYHSEPGEYAFKGFDEGMYTGQLAAAKQTTPAAMQDFKGLHNSFHFENIGGEGWVNTHVNLYKYINFELKQVE